ncbi:MAG TPA: MFS transporter, partial [Candidatus Limnocylindria bacterium]|nr:MFS transporter [Candidatus Limnocylindria bacterium]
LLAGFFSPLTSLLVARFSLVPVMRGIFLFGFVVFTTKLVILHVKSHETETGRKRMEELRGKPLFHSVRGSMGVIRGMLSRRALMLVLGMMACVMVIRGALESFLPLHLTGALGMKPEALPLLSGLKSVGMLACFLVIAPRLKPRDFFRPMAAALSLMGALCLVLFLLPASARGLVYLEVLLEALALSLLIPLFSSLQMLLLDKGERARMYGFSLSFCLLATSPFGTVNGLLSRLGTQYPMLLAAALALLALFLLTRLRRSVAPGQLG